LKNDIKGTFGKACKTMQTLQSWDCVDLPHYPTLGYGYKGTGVVAGGGVSQRLFGKLLYQNKAKT